MTIMERILEAQSQADLSRLTGKPRQTVHNWVKAERIPPRYWPRISEATGIPVQDMLKEWYGDAA